MDALLGSPYCYENTILVSCKNSLREPQCLLACWPLSIAFCAHSPNHTFPGPCLRASLSSPATILAPIASLGTMHLLLHFLFTQHPLLFSCFVSVSTEAISFRPHWRWLCGIAHSFPDSPAESLPCHTHLFPCVLCLSCLTCPRALLEYDPTRVGFCFSLFAVVSVT